MGLYYNGKKVRNLYFNGKCLTRLALGKEMTRLVEGDDFVRAEWLVVPYTSNDANNIPIKSNNFNYKYKFYSFGNIGGIWTTNNKYAYFPNYGRNGIWGVSERTVMYNGKSYELNTEISINCNANGIIMDGELMPNYGSSPYFDNLRIYCYTPIGKYALSAVTVDGVERYIPCRLLRPIPAALDGNGIARSAGECGMYDSVSGKFYGNVGSGSFTVEPSLVEGVDYERHKWLTKYTSPSATESAFSNKAYIDTGIPLSNSMTVDIVVNNRNSCDVALFGARDGSAELNGVGVYAVFRGADITIGKGTQTFIMQAGIDGAIISNLGTQTNCIVNGQEVVLPNCNISTQFNIFIYALNWNNEPRFKSHADGAVQANSANVYVGNMTIKDNQKVIADFVPVRLLRPLPSYLDANGKARHQFECGMLDLKSMKFYGNVNTNGTFTVSDN